jgi:hypothetical protein
VSHDPQDAPSTASAGPITGPGAGDAPAVEPSGERSPDDDAGKRRVAFLLAAAAALVAVLALRAAYLSDEAGGAWQSALRTELQRSAELVLLVRQVYGTEGQEAFTIATHEVLADQMRIRAQGELADVAQALEVEARVHEDLVAQVKPATELTAGGYALPDGGYDLAARLAHYREAVPQAVALDPDAQTARGDRASRHALGVVSAGILVAVALLMGSLAMPYRRRRAHLLALGGLALTVSGLMALGLEVTA